MAVTRFTRVAFEVLRQLNAFDKVSLASLVSRTGESRATISNAINFLALNGLAGSRYGDIYYPTEKGLALLSPEEPKREFAIAFFRNGWEHPLTLEKVISAIEEQQKSIVEVAKDVAAKKEQKRAMEAERAKQQEASRRQLIKKHAKKQRTESTAETSSNSASRLADSVLVDARKKASAQPQVRTTAKLTLKGADVLHLSSLEREIVSILIGDGALSADSISKKLIEAGYDAERKIHSLLKPLIIRGFVGFDAKQNGYALKDKGRNDILEAKGVAMDILSKLNFPYLELRTIELVRDQGGSNGLAERRCERAIANAAKEKELDSSPEAIEKVLSSLESRGLIKRTGNGMTALTVVCRSLIGLRPYSERDVRTLRENEMNEFADILVKFGEAKVTKSKKPKAAKVADSAPAADEPQQDVKVKVAEQEPAPAEKDADSVQAEVKQEKVADASLGEKADPVENYISELMTEESPAEESKPSDAISAVASLKQKLAKPTLPGVESAGEKVQLVDALIDMFSDESEAEPVIAGLVDIKKDLLANAVK